MSRRIALPLLLALLCLLFAAPGDARRQNPCSDGTHYKGCRACGRARRTNSNPDGNISERTRALNVLKNRDEPAEDVRVLRVADLRNPANNDTFTPETAVEVVGYVAGIVPGGFRESCNCGRLELRDIHINIVATPSERNREKRYVVAEITPRWQEKFGMESADYDEMLAAVRQEMVGKWVRFRGWLMYDFQHEGESESTAPGRPGNWRATPWEVHPVTRYEVLPGPPAD
jgi:hypothetical protein